MNKIVLIKIYYLPNTEYNIYRYDSVVFYIELNDKYKDRPKITCHSNVTNKFFILYFHIIQHCYPSLYDNRDFLYLIPGDKNVQENESLEKNEKYNLIKIILEDIPNLIIKYNKKYLEEKKTCLTIGEYKMNFTYYINDFLENNEIYLCRCCINRRFSYVIISDMYFIILHIIKENRQKGKMKFFLELNKLKEIKVLSKENKINLVWEEDALLKDIEYKQEVVFENLANLNEFNDKINNKKNKLLQLFLRFDDDEIRNSPSSILRMINYYEILFEKSKKKIVDDINSKKTNKIFNEKDKTDGLYFKNILIIYYKKACNLYCLDSKSKEKFNERLIALTSDQIIK